MKMLTQSDLSRKPRNELSALFRQISLDLATLRQGSPELRAAQANLQIIRQALARPMLLGPCP